MNRPLARALISVSDKTGIVDFARYLREAGIELLSTGGTAKLLAGEGITVTEVSAHTGFPEIMGGRIKTLHPRIHGGILGRRGTDDEIMREHAIAPIDLVVVNLYPFEATVANPDCALGDAMEHIDIGGPALLRAAAKNYNNVCVIADPADYARVSAEMDANERRVTEPMRFDLAAKAFEHTARYDGAIANYLGGQLETPEDRGFPRTLNRQFERHYAMRYGENPHQRAAFYRERGAQLAGVAGAHQIQGKALSYNNVADADAALECIKQFEETACVIVKHANPCGAATAESVSSAYELAYQTDPTSAFGGVIAFNRTLDESTAAAILARQFVEVIIAPSIDGDTRPLLAQKGNIRVLECGHLASQSAVALDMKSVGGALLVQERDTAMVSERELHSVSQRAPSRLELEDLQFAWRIAKYVKSNAIVYVRHKQTIGIGAGQMSRVYSARIAALKAADEGLEVKGAVMASDAFFPFRDGIDAAANAGVSAVIQPGGSRRDDEIIAAANEHGLAMVFTGMRHFRH